MQNTKLASRYSKALLELALEQNVLDEVYSNMKQLTMMVDENRELQLLLKSPIVKADKKIAIFNELFSAFHKLSKDFVTLITKNRRDSDLNTIAKEFISLYADYKNIQQIVVTTATGLDDTLRAKLKDLTSIATKSEVDIIEKTNPALIGGFVLRIGDNQFDTSIATKIRKVKRELTTGKL